MRSVFSAWASFRERTMALTIAIAVTSTNGIAVHVISSPVLPWMGGPSSSSSGWTLKRATAEIITTATIEKITIQITTTNQVTKWMRVASREASTGSQVGK